jgi:hypothetical protein
LAWLGLHWRLSGPDCVVFFSAGGSAVAPETLHACDAKAIAFALKYNNATKQTYNYFITSPHA